MLLQLRGSKPFVSAGSGGSFGALGDFVDGMSAGSWGQFTAFTGGDVTLVDPGSVGNMLNYAGAQPYDPINKRILVNGGGHPPGYPKLARFDLATSSWLRLDDPTFDEITGYYVSSGHAFQMQTVDPVTGYYYVFSLVSGAGGHGDVYRWHDDTSAWEYITPNPYPGVETYSAIEWFNGKLTWALCDGEYSVSQLDLGTLTWSILTEHTNGGAGVYQNCCVTTPSGLIYGGGNNSTDNWGREKEIYRITAGGVVTQMPDAPRRVGVKNGMSMVGDGLGRVNFVGFGEHWRLDPTGSGAWTQLANAPAGLHTTPQLDDSIFGCCIADLGCSVYTQWVNTHSPATEMWVYKP